MDESKFEAHVSKEELDKMLADSGIPNEVLPVASKPVTVQTENKPFGTHKKVSPTANKRMNKKKLPASNTATSLTDEIKELLNKNETVEVRKPVQ